MLNRVCGRGSILILILSGALMFAASQARAASINYGNFPAGPGVTFENVTESSATDPIPLYGPPSAFLIGLDFDPTNFVSNASGGTLDTTDGQLNTAVQGVVVQSGNVAITSISLSESGDYSLLGTGTSSTQALAGAILNVKVLEVDGVTLGTPISLTPTNASVGFNLVANPGLVQPWSLGLSVNISGQLTALAVPYSNGATRIEVAIDNDLFTLSEAGSIAHIAKKDFVLSVTADTEGVIPEPASAAVGLLVLCGMGLRRRSAK